MTNSQVIHTRNPLAILPYKSRRDLWSPSDKNQPIKIPSSKLPSISTWIPHEHLYKEVSTCLFHRFSFSYLNPSRFWLESESGICHKGTTGKQASDTGFFPGMHSIINVNALVLALISQFLKLRLSLSLMSIRTVNLNFQETFFQFFRLGYWDRHPPSRFLLSFLADLFADLVNRTSLGKASFFKPPYFLTDAINMRPDPAIWKTLAVTR